MAVDKELLKFEHDFKSDIIEISVSNLESKNNTDIIGVNVTNFTEKQRSELIKVLQSTEFEKMIVKTCTTT